MKPITTKMTTRRERSKPQKTLEEKLSDKSGGQDPKVNLRKEKLANYLIDISKYVLTGVVITSLFNDVTDKTVIYLIGLSIVCLTLWSGIILTNKRKGS